jgi:hypothetical protein
MTAFRVFLLAIFCCPLPTLGQESQQWLTGKKLEQAARRSPIFVNWQQVPLHSQLHALSRNLQIPLLIDRRVDPSQLVDRQDRDLTFEQFLWSLGEKENLGVCQVGDLYYLGPEETALALPVEVRALSEQLEDSNSLEKFKQGLMEKVECDSLQPFEPSNWLAQDAAQAELPLLNLEDIPMDWWAPIDWPAMPRYQAYALLAAGFGLSLKLEEAGLRFVKLQLPPELTREYTLSKSKDLSLDELRKRHPKLTLELQKEKLTASGPSIAFASLERQLGTQSRSSPTENGDRRFTLNKTKAPRGSILATIAQQLGLKLKFTVDAKSALNERIELDVQQVTLQELMDKVLAGTDLNFEIKDGEFRIARKE